MTPDWPCAAVRDRLPDYVAGALPENEVAALARHLSGCAACRDVLAEWRSLAEFARAADRAVPPDRQADAAWNIVRARLDAPTAKGPLPMDPFSAPPPVPAPVTVSRWRPLPLVAAILAIIVLAALAGTLALRHTSAPGGGTTTIPTNDGCNNHYQASLPVGASIENVSMLSAQDGWAVGFVDNAPGLPTTLIVHYQACRWTVAAPAIPAARLTGVAMFPDGTGWAVGETLASYTPAYPPGVTPPAAGAYRPDAAFALHFTGGQWQRVALPVAASVDTVELDLLGPTDGWLLAVGNLNYGTSGPADYATTLLRLQGSTWSPATLPPMSSTADVAGGVRADPNGDLWLNVTHTETAQSNAQNPITDSLWRWHQGQWQPFAMPANVIVTDLTLSATAGAWAVGERVEAPNTPNNPFIYHPYAVRFDGTAWQPATVTPDPSADTALNFQGLFGLSAAANGDLYAFGVAFGNGALHGNDTLIYRLVNGQWQLAQTVAVPDVFFIAGLDFTSATAGWTIGTTKGITFPGRAATFGVLIHAVVGGQWTAVGAAGGK